MLAQAQARLLPRSARHKASPPVWSPDGELWYMATPCLALAILRVWQLKQKQRGSARLPGQASWPAAATYTPRAGRLLTAVA